MTINYNIIYLYVLLLEQNKYYIGITYTLEKRLRKHFITNNGSVFTKEYMPIKIIEIIKFIDIDYVNVLLYENVYTIFYSNIYNIQNVAGGSFVFVDDNRRKENINGWIQNRNININEIVKKINTFEKIDIKTLQNDIDILKNLSKKKQESYYNSIDYKEKFKNQLKLF